MSHFLSSRPFNNLLSDNGSQSGAVLPRNTVDALQATSSGYRTTFRIPESGRLWERVSTVLLYDCLYSQVIQRRRLSHSKSHEIYTDTNYPLLFILLPSVFKMDVALKPFFSLLFFRCILGFSRNPLFPLVTN